MKVPAVYTYRENVENYDDSLFAANESGQYVIAQIAENDFPSSFTHSI